VTLSFFKPVCRRRLDPRQLRIGRRIEREHSNDPRVADLIAKHHVCEIPDYYDRLVAMERKAKQHRRR
jgi:hypothetical protein